MSSDKSNQQALQNANLKVEILEAQLQAADQAAANHQAASAAVIKHLQQRLSSVEAQLQQQRQATADALVASAGKTFTCAKLAAKVNTLRTELQDSQQQQQAATTAAKMTTTKHPSAQQQLQSVNIRLESEQQELQDAQAQAAELQQQCDAAASALPKTQGCEWGAASLVAPCAQLQQQYSASSDVSSDGFSPATPFRRTVSEGGWSSSTGSSSSSSSSSSRDASSAGVSLDDSDIFHDAQEIFCSDV
jgi:hypothetical protein